MLPKHLGELVPDIHAVRGDAVKQAAGKVAVVMDLEYGC
jgi:hypothetical protein